MMTSRYSKIAYCAAIAILPLLLAAPAFATQTHGEPEGLYVHQMAHLFFIISMGILEYWLRQRNLVREPGWRYIQIAAVLFILWNLDAIIVHYLAEQIDFLRITPIDEWHILISFPENQKTFAVLYYLAKLDHLVCVPAMGCMYYGLRSLSNDTTGLERPTPRS